MDIFYSREALMLLALSAWLALCCRGQRALRWTGLLCVASSGAALVLTLMEGGSLTEGLIFLLIPLSLLLRKERIP